MISKSERVIFYISLLITISNLAILVFYIVPDVQNAEGINVLTKSPDSNMNNRSWMLTNTIVILVQIVAWWGIYFIVRSFGIKKRIQEIKKVQAGIQTPDEIKQKLDALERLWKKGRLDTADYLKRTSKLIKFPLTQINNRERSRITRNKQLAIIESQMEDLKDNLNAGIIPSSVYEKKLQHLKELKVRVKTKYPD